MVKKMSCGRGRRRSVGLSVRVETFGVRLCFLERQTSGDTGRTGISDLSACVVPFGVDFCLTAHQRSGRTDRTGISDLGVRVLIFVCRSLLDGSLKVLSQRWHG